jgi:hypothetical protein
VLALGSIDAGQLAEVVWVSTVAGIVVTFLFSFAVLFGSRSAEARRGGAAGAAMAYAVLALVCMATFGGVVVYGVHIMLSKS